GEDLLRQLVAGREQQGRPVDAMETEDVLPDQVADVRPELIAEVLSLACVRERAEVVDEGVYPDIDHLLFVPGDRHAPRLPGAADAEVREPALDEAPSLVVAEAREHELRLLVVE